MKTRFLLLLTLSSLLGGCGPSEPPNIVLITLDAFRADSLAAYGGPPDLTPNLNALAERGAVFENAYTVMGETWPVHATILTGLYPRSHGLRRNSHTLPEDYISVAEVVRQAGYHTGSFVSYPQMHFVGNLDQGFDALSDPKRRKGIGHSRDGAETTAMAIDWLRRISAGTEESRKPFFLWYHLFDAHGPYRPNEFSQTRLSTYDGMLKDGATMEHLKKHVSEIIESPADLQALRTLYEGEVHKVDRHVGELMAALEAMGLDENTVVIVTADHGQAIGEGGRMGHGPILWETVLRVPLIFAGGGQDSARIGATVGVVDLAPTILELAGIEHEIPVQGRSLVPALEGEPLEPRAYYAEVGLRRDKGEWYHPDRIAVYDDGYKLVFDPEQKWLYDLSANADGFLPVQMTDHQVTAGYLIGLAEDYLKREPVSYEAELSDEDIETLRSLGYIQ